jgi:hypothetical protein
VEEIAAEFAAALGRPDIPITVEIASVMPT